ncbi:hypothetical protein SAMN05421740_102555 [Parapedobacter koreensis]|uniref:Uncharacterized protein n=1 Tax=Parapedobacter koreensis TaxID=332977 RepID=A0A1H7JGS9_9SPHI|nr:hypothetical protein SAMN05421740_102555 [Parapedobacter koreensis]
MSYLANTKSFLFLAVILSGCSSIGSDEEWRTVTGTNEGMRYVASGDITADNVKHLQVA